MKPKREQDGKNTSKRFSTGPHLKSPSSPTWHPTSSKPARGEHQSTNQGRGQESYQVFQVRQGCRPRWHSTRSTKGGRPDLHRDDPPTPDQWRSGRMSRSQRIGRKCTWWNCRRKGTCHHATTGGESCCSPSQAKYWQESSWRDSRRPWMKLYERRRQVFAKTHPAQTTSPCRKSSWSGRWNGRPHCTQYSSTSKRHLTVWIETSFGGSCNSMASSQVHFYHTATVRQLQLPSRTWREVDEHIPGTNRCSSSLIKA